MMSKEEQVKQLWRENFNDSEEFISFYFAHKYRDENSLVYEENGKALSAFLMLPYPMTWQGIQLNTSYISGACTIKEARNHGLMTLLISEAFHEMNKRGVALSTLIPAEDWLFDYYGNLGYVSLFDYSIEKYIPGLQLSDPDITVNSTSYFDYKFASHFFPFFDQQMKNRTCCVQHPLEDYTAIVEEVYLYGGQLFTTSASGQISGWAVALPDQKKQILVKELFYQTEREKTAILEAVATLWQADIILCRRPPDATTSYRYGMARITDVLQLLNHTASLHPELTFTLQVNDPILDINNGIFKLSHGTCQKMPSNEGPSDIATDIPSLTKALLGYRNNESGFLLSELSEPMSPYMNLMLD